MRHKIKRWPSACCVFRIPGFTQDHPYYVHIMPSREVRALPAKLTLPASNFVHETTCLPLLSFWKLEGKFLMIVLQHYLRTLQALACLPRSVLGSKRMESLSVVSKLITHAKQKQYIETLDHSKGTMTAWSRDTNGKICGRFVIH